MSLWDSTGKQRAELELTARDPGKLPLGPALCSFTNSANVYWVFTSTVPSAGLSRDTNFDHVIPHPTALRWLPSTLWMKPQLCPNFQAPALLSSLMASLPHQPLRSATLLGSSNPSHKLSPLPKTVSTLPPIPVKQLAPCPLLPVKSLSSFQI